MVVHRRLRTALSVFGLCSMLAVLPGCPLSPDGGKGPIDTRPPERNSVTGAIAQYAFIWTNKRYEYYELLLHDNFEYFPQTTDLVDFPWLGSAISWGRTDELQMAGNMFNKDFVGTNGNAVETITMVVDVESQTDTVDGVVVQTHAVATVLWAESNGLRSDVRFEFLVVPDPDEAGQYQIKEQREQSLIG